jgi:hypothetical protein
MRWPASRTLVRQLPNGNYPSPRALAERRGEATSAEAGALTLDVAVRVGVAVGVGAGVGVGIGLVARSKRGVRQLLDAAFIKKGLGCSPIAGRSLSHCWSRSRCQLHTPDRCNEPGQCRRWNRYRNHRSPLLRSALHPGRRRCWLSSTRSR